MQMFLSPSGSTWKDRVLTSRLKAAPEEFYSKHLNWRCWSNLNEITYWALWSFLRCEMLCQVEYLLVCFSYQIKNAQTYLFSLRAKCAYVSVVLKPLISFKLVCIYNIY